jgi:hypothetical protein
MHTAIYPKNGSVSSGIIPSTVVSTTMQTGRILLVATVDDRLIRGLAFTDLRENPRVRFYRRILGRSTLPETSAAHR